jgi:hypothetical protein
MPILRTMDAWAVWCLLYGAVSLALAPFVALKGKWGALLVGLIVPVVWIATALRLAKPTSWWAKRFYDREQMEEARERHSWRRG